MPMSNKELMVAIHEKQRESARITQELNALVAELVENSGNTRRNYGAFSLAEGARRID